jgi:hypothetical protein
MMLYNEMELLTNTTLIDESWLDNSLGRQRPSYQGCELTRATNTTILLIHCVSLISGKLPADWDPSATSVTVLKGVDAKDKMKCFDEIADRIQAAKFNYKGLGPNSNTVVTTMLKLCGVPLIKPPGWFVGSNEILPGFRKSGQ